MTEADLSQPLIQFYQFIESAHAPQRADRSAGGLLPTRAFRYCEAVTTASAFGWYVFPPIQFSLMWTGVTMSWNFPGADEWLPLGRAQFPDFRATFDAQAPASVTGYSPPFLAALPEPGVVQVWSGLLARSRPGWSALVRPPANLPRQGDYELFEGIVETDRWFGPLFTNVRLTKTDVPVSFDADYPLFQVQPLHRSSYGDEHCNDFSCVRGVGALSPEDWAAFAATVVKPGPAVTQPLGADATVVRRRRRKDSATPPRPS